MSKNWQERFDEMSEINEFYGLPYNDLVDSSIKQFISDLITQTREETIREIASKLPRQVIGANLNIEKILNKLKK